MTEEKDIKGSPQSVSIQCTEIILEQIKHCICKIKLDFINGTGFFCKIPEGINKTMNCLITNNHILNEKYYDENNELILLLNDEKEIKVLDLRTKRRTYFSKEYDIALIELNKDDKIDKFLEINNRLYEDEKSIKMKFKNESIYIIQYPEGNAAVSYGLLNKIDKYEIQHLCCTKNGSSGSPILYLKSNKVIGIHKNSSKNDNFNGGTLLNVLLNDIIYKIKKKKNGVNKSTEIINDNNMINYDKESWMSIFNKQINDFDEYKKKVNKLIEKLDKEIEEIAQNKINEINFLHNKFKKFYGIKNDSFYFHTLENLLKVMTSSLIGIPIGEIDISDFCLNIFRGRIKNHFIIKTKFINGIDARMNLTKNRQSLFVGLITNLYYCSLEKNKNITSLLEGWLTIETLGKMVIDNIFEDIFVYNTDEELDKIFDIAVNEMISYIRDKNNYNNTIKDSSGKYVDSDIIYKEVINKFDKLINNIDNSSIKYYKKYESDNKIKNFLRKDWNVYLIQLGIICPIKGRNIPWINNKLN